MNNSSSTFKGGPRPIVQFSIEDLRALKKKQERHEKVQADRKKSSFTNKNFSKKPKAGLKNDRSMKKTENKRFNQPPGERNSQDTNIVKKMGNPKKNNNGVRKFKGKKGKN